MPLITLPTRFSSRRATLIDQIFCRPTTNMYNHKSGIIVSQISDHLPCFSAITIPIIENNTPQTVTRRVNTPSAIANFKTEIENRIKESILGIIHHTDPNETYNKLEHIIQSSKDKHLPLKTVKFNRYKHKISPWITNEILIFGFGPKKT